MKTYLSFLRAVWPLWWTFSLYKSVSGDSNWCPQYHLIRSPNVYDPSGPLFIDDKWHVFEDSCEWCHWMSDDLIHWKQLNNTPFSGLTGSIGYPNQGNDVIAFFPDSTQTYIMRAVNDINVDSTMQSWNVTGIV